MAPLVVIPVSIPVAIPVAGLTVFLGTMPVGFSPVAVPVCLMTVPMFVAVPVCLMTVPMFVTAAVCLVAVSMFVTAAVCLVAITVSIAVSVCLVAITVSVAVPVCLVAITVPVAVPVCFVTIAAMIAVADANIKTAVVRIVAAMISGKGCPIPVGAVQLFPAQIAVAIAISPAELVAYCMAQLSAGDHAVAVQIVKMKRARVDGAQIGRSATMASATGAKGDPEILIAEDHADVWTVVMAAAAMFQTAQRLSGKLAVIVAIKSVKNTHELLDHLPLGDPSIPGEGGGRRDYGE